MPICGRFQPVWALGNGWCPFQLFALGTAGNQANSSLYSGAMDEVAIYAAPLSAARVAAHYALRQSPRGDASNGAAACAGRPST